MEQPEENINFVEITSPLDPLLVSWLALYEIAFPPEERMLIADFVDALQDKTKDLDEDFHFIAATDESGEFLGLANYHTFRDECLTVIWYLAVSEKARNLGIGSKIYQEIARRAREDGSIALLYEVEIPEIQESREKHELASRRIGFYSRLGGKLLKGIHYLQSVGPHQPSIPMHIMVHPFEELSPEKAFNLARKILGDTVTQTSPLELA